MTPVLTVDGLTVSTAAGVDIVTDVSFSVPAGVAVGMVGESGSGKTLTGLACMDLLPPGLRVTAGSVSVDGDVVVAAGRPAARRRRRVAMVFQNPMTSLNPTMRVGAQIAESVRRNTPGTGRPAAAQAAVRYLTLVDIPEPERRARQWPHELSGGQRQRVVIAIALACDARVLIADEPTTALDVTTQAGVVQLLARLRDELGLAVVFVSHDLALVSQVCSTTMVMYAGELVEQGPTTQLLLRPEHPYLTGLLSCLPERVTGTLLPLPGRVPQPGSYPSGCRFAPRCGHERELCHDRQELLPVGPERSVRCVRHADVAGVPPVTIPEEVVS